MNDLDKLDKFLNLHLKKAKELENIYILSKDKENLQKELLSSFKKFAIYFWDEASTSNPYVETTTIDCICAVIDAIMNKHLKDTLIVCPLREGKSTLVSVIFPVYAMLLNPRISFLTVTYTSSLSYKFNQESTDLIKSKKFQNLFGNKLSIKSHTQEKTRTKQGGVRFAIAMDGKGTGIGGDVVLLDDPMDLTQIEYPNYRKGITDRFTRVIYNRRNKFNESILLGVSHRSHPEDLFEFIISRNDPDLTYINLPFLYIPEQHTKILSKKDGSIIWEDNRKERGDLISPKRYTLQDVEKIRMVMKPHEFEALYQGNPIPETGQIIKSEWFKKYDSLNYPNFKTIIQSWDLAMSTKVSACFSASTTWGIFENKYGTTNILLLNAWAGRLEFPDLIEMIRYQSRNIYDTDITRKQSKNIIPPDILLIEENSIGKSMIQTLRREGIQNIAEYVVPRRKGMSGQNKSTSREAKVERIRKVSILIESGRVYLPVKVQSEFTEFSKEFMKACTMFPNNIEATLDLVDTFSMTLDYLSTRKILKSDAQYQQEKIKLIDGIMYMGKSKVKNNKFLWENNNLFNKYDI